MKDGVQTMINGSYVIKSQTSKTSNITKVTISRLKNNGGLVMDNGTLVQINTKTELLKNRVSKVWLSDDLKMKALINLFKHHIKKMTLGIAGKG
jgi:hypothetical protein